MADTMAERYAEAAAANGFLEQHCQHVLQEIAKGYRGVSHSVALCHQEYAEQHERLKALEERCLKLEAERDKHAAAIGALEEAVEKARGAFRALQKGNKQETAK